MKQKEFYRLLEDATEVRMDPSGRRFLVRLPLLGWRAYRPRGGGGLFGGGRGGGFGPLREAA